MLFTFIIFDEFQITSFVIIYYRHQKVILKKLNTVYTHNVKIEINNNATRKRGTSSLLLFFKLFYLRQNPFLSISCTGGFRLSGSWLQAFALFGHLGR